MRGRKRLHHEVFLEGARLVPDFLAATRDDVRLGPASDLTRTKLASQAAQEATCQSSDGDSGRMRFSCEHAGQAMDIGNFCSSSFHVRSIARSRAPALSSRNNSSANCPKRNLSDGGRVSVRKGDVMEKGENP
jgi:hypothetical protein